MLLSGKDFSYAYWLNANDPVTGLPVPGLGSRRYTVFRKPVTLCAMELTRPGGCLGGRPERTVIEAYSEAAPKGIVLFDGELPWNGDDKCCLQLPNVPVLAVSQRCHWHSGYNVDFMEWHPAPYTVPFNIFDGTCWFGDFAPQLAAPEPPAPPVLRRKSIDPSGCRGLEAWTDGMFVWYRSLNIQVGFSLVRPRMSYLAWDGMGAGRVERNFLINSATGFEAAPTSGPWRRHLGFELPAMLWTGAVEVNGCRVAYRNINSLSGFSMDVEFEVNATGFTMHITQSNDHEQSFLEAEAWRWAWDGRQAHSLSTLAMPLRGNHRNGVVAPLGGWHSSGQGTLSFASASPSLAGMQIDTAGFGVRQAFGGLLLGVRLEPFGPVTLLDGDHSADIDFRVTNLEPTLAPDTAAGKAHPGLLRAWGSAFAFRPEHGGFSNNSFGVNAENCLYLVADLAPYTRTRTPLPPMTVLLRYSVELAIKGGPGYACFLEEGHDTAPSQLISAGRVYQAHRNAAWVRDVWPFLSRRIDHILGSLNEDGFYICHRLSGNSRTFHTSCNANDTFCIGHADGYSAALAYRGLRNANVLARAAGHAEVAENCILAAQRLKASFVPTLFNPDTGWLAGWRSADGELHDYAMHPITALAAIYGILNPEESRSMLANLERKRLSEGLDDFRYGLPPQFIPVAAHDHWSEGGWSRGDIPHRSDGADTFGIFTNGGITPIAVGFYIRALSQFGQTDTADRLCDQLLDSFEHAKFDGCLNGVECFTVDGMPSGYEGTLAHSFHVLLAIGMHRGWIKPLEPEWWPGE